MEPVFGIDLSGKMVKTRRQNEVHKIPRKQNAADSKFVSKRKPVFALIRCNEERFELPQKLDIG
jgi:hypothetical protein